MPHRFFRVGEMKLQGERSLSVQILPKLNMMLLSSSYRLDTEQLKLPHSRPSYSFIPSRSWEGMLILIPLGLDLYRWCIARNSSAAYDLSIDIIHLYSSRMYRVAVAISRMIRRS